MTKTINPMDNPAFLAAATGATLPGMRCYPEFGGFLSWTSPEGSDDAVLWATPNYEGENTISISIEVDGFSYSHLIERVEWTGDAAEDIHIYLAKVRRWVRTLPTIYARWDGDPRSEWRGNVFELVVQYCDSGLFIPALWHGACRTGSLLELIDEHDDFVFGHDNVVVRSSPFPDACMTCGREL